MSLLIVSTPIGNLGDISYRAADTLKSVDYVLCEDTRVTGKLLNHLGIDKKMVVLNDFNEQREIERIIADLADKKNIALVSDAGTPLVSDPGYKLVREAIARKIDVQVIPGPSAVIAALTVSGLPPDKFTFLGFLPKKDGHRIDLLAKVKVARESVKSTLIIYESPFRVEKTLGQIKDVFGDIEVAVCRELTKMHEEVHRGKISEFKMTLKGEFVILF